MFSAHKQRYNSFFRLKLGLSLPWKWKYSVKGIFNHILIYPHLGTHCQPKKFCTVKGEVHWEKSAGSLWLMFTRTFRQNWLTKLNNSHAESWILNCHNPNTSSQSHYYTRLFIITTCQHINLLLCFLEPSRVTWNNSLWKCLFFPSVFFKYSLTRCRKHRVQIFPTGAMITATRDIKLCCSVDELHVVLLICTRF